MLYHYRNVYEVGVYSITSFYPLSILFDFINVNTFQILEANSLIFFFIASNFSPFPSLLHWLEFLLPWFVHSPDMSSCRKVCTLKNLNLLVMLESHVFFF